MAGEESTARDAPALLIDLESHQATPLTELTLSQAGLRERDDLQRWVTEHPELIASDLKLVTTEFDRWEIRDQKVYDRLDALFLDSSGALVVVEFKRDRASDTVELQALKYAAYCSQLTLDEIVEEFARAHDCSEEEAKQRLADHAPVLEDGALGSVRVMLVAGGFGPAVTSVLLWLRENGIDIGCVEVTAQAVPEHAMLSARQIIPLPEAEDYLVRRRRKEQEHGWYDSKPPKEAGRTTPSASRPSGSPSPESYMTASLDTWTIRICPGRPRCGLGGSDISEPGAITCP